jgi:CBS domain-containing protein
VDVQERVIGVVSKTDLLNWCVTGGLGFAATNVFAALADRPARRGRADVEDMGIVEDFMSSEPVLATEGEPVASIAQRMAQEKIHRIIVVDEDGCLTGIVTSLDLLKVFPQ